MAKITRNRRRFSSRQFRSTPYPIPHSYSWVASKPGTFKSALALERKDWVEATCSVCMEFPHNAVLLLCSSHEKGCRPYMCGTNYRHSNCLDQFKKAYTKVRSSQLDIAISPTNTESLFPARKALELACPLCRGQVKGWTVVEPAREYLNKKMRNCMQDGCPFVGTYRELKGHVKSEHPCAKPHEVDPELEEKWRSLERERERQDVISTITSSMPRSVVFGDYVIEMANSEVDSEDDFGAGEFRGSPGISSSILYFFLREGAGLMRFQRDEDEEEDEGIADGGGYDNGLLNGEDGGVATVFNRARAMELFRSDRRQRRRRRRSRGSLAFDVS